MARKPIQPAWRGVGSGQPVEVVQMLQKTGETLVDGSLVVVDANGEITLCGADPAEITGVCMAPNDSAYGYGLADSPSVVTGRVNELPIGKADRVTVWKGVPVDGAVADVTPLRSHVGKQYSFVKDADNIWCIDTSDTTTQACEVVDFDADEGVLLFKFTDTVVAEAN